MAITLEIGEVGLLNEHVIDTMEFLADTPDDSNARSTDLSNTLKVTGRILTALDGEDSTEKLKKLAEWANRRAEDPKCYTKVKAKVVSAGKIIRQVTFTQGFMVDYQEVYGISEGVGVFTAVIRQKKDKINDVEIEGAFDGGIE